MNMFEKFLKKRPKIQTVDFDVIGGKCCPKCKEDGIFLYSINTPPFYLCENCQLISTVEEVEHFNNRKLRKEKLLKLKNEKLHLYK